MPDDPGTGAKDESTFYPIIVDIGVEDADRLECWAICETDGGAPLEEGANSIVSCTDLGQGRYELILDHGAKAGYVTTIEYLGDITGTSYVEYIHLPADADGSGDSNGNDIIAVVDCLNHQNCENYEADIDASNDQTGNDVIEVVDLLNGMGAYDPWFMVEAPENNGNCPACVRDLPLGRGGEGDGGRGIQSAPEVEQEEQPFGPWFAGYLMAADPADEGALAELVITVEALTRWCAEQLSSTEKRELITLLTDPEAEFASEAVRALVPRIVAALR